MLHTDRRKQPTTVTYLVLVVCFITLNPHVFSKEAIWIEGEDYGSSSFNRHGWYQNTNIYKDLLSPGQPGQTNGAWHVHYAKNDTEAIATYTFSISEGGPFTGWIRLNPFRNHNGGSNYSLRSKKPRGQWTDWVSLDVSEARDTMIDLVDPGIDIRFIAWSPLGSFTFTTGTHELQIRLARQGDRENHGGIDVIAFTNFPWAPTGLIPPSTEELESQPDEWFPLMVGPDTFSPNAIIDMSHLIERPAGQHGFLQRVHSDFAFQDAAAVKFWGIDASMAETVEAQVRQARFYAKHGINMVRQHPVEGILGSLEGPRTQRRFNPEKLDRFDHWFSLLKANGIYMTWSIFYHHVLLPDQGIDPGLYHELPDRDAGKDCYGMATFITEYQDAQWDYARQLLEHVNPYTGLAYKNDPALAMVEARNEDSIFFHNPLGDRFVRGLSHPIHGTRLKQMWQQWVKNRYRTNNALALAWGQGLKKTAAYNSNGSVRSRPDSIDETNMYMYAAWEMEKDGPRWNTSAERTRLGDFIRFLAEMQRDTYTTYQSRLRDLGYEAVVVSTAWKAGGSAASAANFWTDDGLDAIDRHNYFGGGAGGHSITTGSVNNDTHLTKPGRAILSSGFWQGEDKPFIITEWTQKPPNQWKAEIAPLMACYGMGLQGWDAVYHFAGSSGSMGNGWPRMSSYVTETPHYIGQFPALTFALLHGHFDEGPIIAARRLSTDTIFTGTDALQQTYGKVGYDENELLTHGHIPVEALAIGRVTLSIKDNPSPSHLISFENWWDRLGQTVQSTTGQLTWDYGERMVWLHSDRTQGLVGFTVDRSYDLPGVIIKDIKTSFISLLFTPLDNHPLIESSHILITAMARDKQLGTQYSPQGTQLLETGGPPLLMEPVQASITLKGEALTSVQVVDVYGVPTERQVDRHQNTFHIDGRYGTYYYEAIR